MKKLIMAGVLGSIVLVPLLAQIQEPVKKKIESIDDLPRYTYAVEEKVSELYADKEAFHEFARLVCADIKKDLETYDIQDNKTLRSYYSTLLTLDMMKGDYEVALRRVYMIRELHDNIANRLTSGIVDEAIVRAYREAGPNGKPDRDVFMRHFMLAVDTLPWEIVQEKIEQLKGQMDICSENLMLGLVEGQFDPVVGKTGQISNDIATRLISMRYVVDFQLPLKEQIIAVLEKYIATNRFEKKDIWHERDVALTEVEGLHTVLVAIWDTGIDVDVYPNQLFVNPEEEFNGKDDDLNGFIDDVNGIAYNLEEEKTPEMLYPLEDAEERLPELRTFIKGYLDIRAAVESPEATTLKKKLSELPPEEMKTVFEDLQRIVLYAHGTLVAGIAIEGNPYARILVVRVAADYRTIPMAPTIERSRKMAQNYRETIDYMKAHDVRVVNMSWGGVLRETERDLEANGIGETAEERARLARKIFDIEKEALYEAMKGAPGILFVCACATANDDVAFEDYYPAAFDIPNLLVVGAVDKAGDVTSFTSVGATAGVYANGFEVESHLPGGDRLAASGTSASSANATNLAAKLLALRPSLTPPEVIALIKDAAEPNTEGLPVMNPRRSAELLKDL